MSSLLKTNSISAATGSTVSIPSGTTLDIASGGEIDIASGATLDINGTVDFAGATVSNLSAGKLLQVQHTAYASQSSNHNTSSWNTTGSMSVSITPSSASNMILVMSSDSFYLAGNGAANTSSNAAIFETGSSTMVAFKFLGHNGAPASFDPCTMIGIYDPSDTSALTFQTKSYNGGAYYTQPRTNQGQDSGNIYHIMALEYEV